MRHAGRTVAPSGPPYTDGVEGADQRMQFQGDALPFGPRAVLVPVKAFREAKRRLDTALSDSERAALAAAMAHRVLAAAFPLPVAVVCDDNEVATWARSRGALVVWEPGRGLNGAVEAGVELLSQRGVEKVTVAHACLLYTSDAADD